MGTWRPGPHGGGEKKFVKGLDIQQGRRMIRGVGSALGAF